VKNRKHQQHRARQKIMSVPQLPTPVVPLLEVEPAPLPVSTVVAITPVDPLVDEVQSFLQRRESLAQKLAEEIAATEKKLAELKRTAALLYPEKAAAVLKDRKVKKLKKARPLGEKSESAASLEVSASPMEVTEG
jgi:hypothetical protein